MSTDKPTPETDAKSSTREIRNLNAFWTVEEVPANFARTLERQRDEYARQLADERVSVDRLETELSAILEHVREAMDIESMDASTPAELVAILISQRDNANNEASAYRAERDALKLKWESDEPGKPGRILRALADRLAKATNSEGSSRPPTCHLEDLLSEFAQLRAELAALREEAEKWKRVCRSYDDSPSRKFREEFQQLQSNHSQLRQDACKILRELIQSQLHFDYTRALYTDDTCEALAHAVSEASCRRSDAVEVGEEFLRLNTPKPATAEHTPAEETKL